MHWLAMLVVLAVASTTACAAGDAPTTGSSVTPTREVASAVAGGRTTVLTGAAPAERKSGTIKVAAAADLRTALTLIQPDIERQCETKLAFVFGSSGQLTTQVAAGADFGVLLSADAQYPADLLRAGAVVPNGIASYAVGRIALATRAGLDPITDVASLARADVRTIAIANPLHAPYGRAAEQALRQAGVYDRIKNRLVLADNIRQATDYVEQGNADAAIVAYALVINGSPAKWTLIDASMHRPIEQGGAVIKGSGAELTGRCVLQYILDPAGQAALRQFGFEPVAPR